MNEENEDELRCLKIKKPSPNWCIIPEVLNRQIGSNPLFQRRFYSSLHAVERLELMYQLNEHQVYYYCISVILFIKHPHYRPITYIDVYIDNKLLFIGLCKCFKL